MRNRSRILKGIALALGMSLVVGTVSASHSWNNYHWARNTSSFNLQVIDSTTPNWDVELGHAVNEWSQSNSLNLNVTAADDSSKTRRRCPAVSGKIRVCNMAYGSNGWLGLASINLDSQGHISQGTAKMNDSYFMDANERRHVMCQEV
ncbi:MAG: hypothetical protein ABIP02_02725, partial [Arenimonas sp.]